MMRSLVTLLAAAAISMPPLVAPAILTPAAAQASMSFGVTIGVSPPAPVYEPLPPPRRGYVWAPGYWRWEGGRHVWAPAQWIAEGHGYYWVPDRWAHVDGGWRHERGRWDRDWDHHRS